MGKLRLSIMSIKLLGKVRSNRYHNIRVKRTYPLRVSISGAMYSLVPHSVRAFSRSPISLARPKSVIHTWASPCKKNIGSRLVKRGQRQRFVYRIHSNKSGIESVCD